MRLLAGVLFVFLGGCGATALDEGGSSTPQDAGTTPPDLQVDCTPVATPGGYAPRGCIIELTQNNSFVTEDDMGNTIVSVGGVVVATYPPCRCDIDRDMWPGLPSPPHD
jgi:hypothetical protein